jgi:glycosyltransferase involved in cell wall biosynthesis
VSARPLRIAISAELRPSRITSGVEQVVAGLVGALGRLTDGDEEYVLLCHPEEPDWLAPWLGSNQIVVVRHGDFWKRTLGPLRGPVGRLYRRALSSARGVDPSGHPLKPEHVPPDADRFLHDHRADVVHFPFQQFCRTSLPMIYNPHDLQHRHFPEFFRAEVLEWRETVYRAGCALAETVVMSSRWARQDLISEYGVAASKVLVIPWAAPTDILVGAKPTENELARVARHYDLPSAFALYPATTWPHKNHLKLLEAIALLRDRHGSGLGLVCSGALTDHWAVIQERIRMLGLESLVRFVGVVAVDELHALYSLARLVVMPTLHDPATAPIYEAWSEGVPVACSSAAGLPEQAGDAAVQFDPTEVESIAGTMLRVMRDEGLREELVRRGHRRIALFSWDRTARTYRALYRHLAKRPLDTGDRARLAEAAIPADVPAADRRPHDSIYDDLGRGEPGR